MEGVMTQAEAQRHLARSAALFAHVQPTYEPIDQYEILRERTVRYDYICDKITTDHNCKGFCLSRAISKHVYGHGRCYYSVFLAGVARLVEFRHLYEVHTPEGMTYDQYVSSVYGLTRSISGCNLPALFRYALADAFGLRIVELSADKKHSIVEYVPDNKRINDTIHIASSSRHTDSMRRG